MAASGNAGELVMVNDVSRAFFHAKACREVFVQLADEDKQKGEERMCGKLNYSMYGTRDAAQNWAKEYSDMLISIGFKQGRASPCVFHHQTRGIRTFVHGDDYVSVAEPKELDWMKKQLEGRYKIKTQWLGPGEEHQQEVKILNRVVCWCNEKGITFEADPGHTEIIIDQLKLKDAKAVCIPGTQEEGTTTQDADEELDDSQAFLYRAITARCNYISPDGPDIAYAVKELARRMSKPTKGDWQRSKRLGRYLLGKPRLQQLYKWQQPQQILKVYTNADWAGCRETRKSTTGGCAMLGAHTLKGWSKTQSLVALSSSESELYAALKASAEALGRIALLQDFGYTVKGEVWGDASAAIGIINRKGLGKTKHIDTGLLWIQQTAADQRLKYAKVLGEESPADVYTKFLDSMTSNIHLKKLEYQFTHGRSSEAPQLHEISVSIDEYRYGHEYKHCEWVQIMINGLSQSKHNEPRRSRNAGQYMLTRGSEKYSHNHQYSEQETKNGECNIDVWHQVLWGSKPRIQGSNGSNAAQLNCPQGATLTFQRKAGVSCGTGLKHGVTMHPRGRHLREAITLMPHGMTQWTACEQQPQSTLHNQQPLLLQPLGPMTLLRNWNRRHLKTFPRRGVSQESSTAGLCDELGEPNQETGPTVNLLK